MLTPYRRVLALPGALSFSGSGLVARLPMSMVSLGVVILVSERTGSYAVAGAVSASYIGATAIGGIPLARIVDRGGQGRVLGRAVAISVVSMVALVLLVENGAGFPWPHLAAALSGLTMPNIGAAVRARWSALVSDRRMLDTAFALEAVNDEVVFIAGPALAAGLAVGVHPAAGVVAAALAAVVGTTLLVRQRGTEPPRTHAGDGPSLPMPWRRLLPLMLGAVALGATLGGTEVATVALADERNHPAAAGALLAVWAAGSLLAGLAAGTLTFRRTPDVRYRIGATSLAVLLLPTPFVHTLPLIAVVLFLGGFAIAPTLIAAVTWVETIVPTGRLNEGLAAVTTGLVAGVAPGAAFVGAAVDAHGASASYWVPIGAALVGAAAAYVASPPRLAPRRGPVVTPADGPTP